MQGSPKNSRLAFTSKHVSNNPGPGAYHHETNTLRGSRNIIGRTSGRSLLNNCPSGNNSARSTAFESSQLHHRSKELAKILAIPSIPNRFLGPVLKFDLHEKDAEDTLNRELEAQGYNVYNGQAESYLVSKVAMLTNDGSIVGPGSYDSHLTKGIGSSSKGVGWGTRTAKRPDLFTSKATTERVGPGAYLKSQLGDRSTRNATIPKSFVNSRTQINFNGHRVNPKTQESLRLPNTFEEESDEEPHTTPGPGEYLKPHHTSGFGLSSFIHKYP